MQAIDWTYGVLPTLLAITELACAAALGMHVTRVSFTRSKTTRRRVEATLLSILAVGLVVLAGICGYNALMLHAARLQMPGRLYSVNGHAMRLDCAGTGEPTIVLDAGLGNDGLIWGGVQPVLSRTTRVCSYDRAGFGLSDALPGPRDANHIADELHGLLTAAKVDGPVVLMVHSIAGVYLRAYATRYPAQLKGLVIVDGSTPLQNHDPAFAALDAKNKTSAWKDLFTRIAMVSGIPRLLGVCSLANSGLDLQAAGFDRLAAKLQGEDECHEQFAAVDAEMKTFDQSGEETVHAGPFGSLPILIFSHDPASAASNPSRGNVEKAWAQMQANEKRLSTRSQQIIAKGSGHYIQLERAALIDQQVAQFIRQIRGTSPSPTNYGTTMTE